MTTRASGGAATGTRTGSSTRSATWPGGLPASTTSRSRRPSASSGGNEGRDVMAAKFMHLVLTPAVQAAQDRYFGKRQAAGADPGLDELTADEAAFVAE